MQYQKISCTFKKIICVICCISTISCISPVQSYAQLTITERITFDLPGNSNDEFNVIPFKENGILVLNNKSNFLGRDLEINFVKYDTTLVMQWANSYAPGAFFRMIKYYETESHLFCLFRKDESHNIMILRLDINTGDYVVTDTQLLTLMAIDHFSVIKSKVLIGGTYNERPVVELVNLFSNSAKVLPEIHSNNVKLNTIEVNDQEELIYVLLKNDRNCKLFIKVYDYEGRLIGSETLGEKNKLPLNGKLVKIPNGHFVLTGNYADNCSDYSVGFYIHSLSDEEETRYYNFLELDNFLSYLNDKRQLKVKNRIKKRNLQGKEYKHRQRLLIQDPIKEENGMIMLAEVFYPEFKNYTSNINPIGRNYRWNSSNFYTYNNFKYTHALIIKFDSKGKLDWDQSISLNDLQSRTLDHKIQISSTSDDRYVVAYPDEGIIKTTTFSSSTQSKEDISMKFETLDENILETSQSELSSWYSHSFLAYGIQHIKPRGSLYPREVFYINKLVYK